MGALQQKGLLMTPTTPASPAPALSQGAAAQGFDTEVDFLEIGSGTGMFGALAAHEAGLTALVLEKTDRVGGSLARSGGAFWIPGNEVLDREGASDTAADALAYLRTLTADAGIPDDILEAYLALGPETVALMERTTLMEFFWAKGYSDYHPELPGGSAEGRTVECAPFDLAALGEDRPLLREAVMEAPVPMPVTGADYKWLNLIARTPARSLPRALRRVIQGVGGKTLGKELAAGGQAIAGGLFAGLRAAGIPVWTNSEASELLVEGDRVVGAVVIREGRRVQVRARRGVLLAAGGFDHDLALRRQVQSEVLTADVSLGATGSTGDGLRIGESVGAGTALLEESWWFPALAQPGAAAPLPLLAERSLPGSFMIDRHGKRFINESRDYMSFGQEVLRRFADGDPLGTMWLVFDQRYRRNYLLGGTVMPGLPLPAAWIEGGVAALGETPAELAAAMGVRAGAFEESLARFNHLAGMGTDHDFGRGASAYDRYYGDPTQSPNPNLRPLAGRLFAVQVVLSDLGTCGGLVTDERARVLRPDGSPIAGLYAAGNTSANVFGHVYPGAGATIGQGLVFAVAAARDAAGLPVA